MKEEKLKPHKYYVVFAVRKPDAEDIANIKKKLGPNAEKYPAEFACKISMLVHNIEDESFAVYVCQSLLDQEQHAHLHYTEQGNCLHEYAVDDCDICKDVIMRKFGEVIAKKTGKEIVKAKEIAGVGVVFAKESDNQLESHDHPEHN